MAIPIDKKETLERMRALPQVRRWREGNYDPAGGLPPSQPRKAASGVHGVIIFNPTAAAV
jgi:hypothetical protein